MGGRVATTSAMCGSRRPIPVRSAVCGRASLVMATFLLLFTSVEFLLRLKPATNDAVAVARGHVDPGFRIAIEFRGTPTRVVAGRRAVVLAGLRDAVAL